MYLRTAEGAPYELNRHFYTFNLFLLNSFSDFLLDLLTRMILLHLINFISDITALYSSISG